jgi:hypothetical protein
MKTTLEEFQEFLKTEVQLGFNKQEYIDRLNYYIDTFFKEKEKQQILNAINETQNMKSINDTVVKTYENGWSYLFSSNTTDTLGEKYFNYKFKK